MNVLGLIGVMPKTTPAEQFLYFRKGSALLTWLHSNSEPFDSTSMNYDDNYQGTKVKKCFDFASERVDAIFGDAETFVSGSVTAEPVVDNYLSVYTKTYDAYINWDKAFEEVDRAMANRDNSEREEDTPSAPVYDTLSSLPNTGYRKIAGWLEKTKQEVQKVKIDRY